LHGICFWRKKKADCDDIARTCQSEAYLAMIKTNQNITADSFALRRVVGPYVIFPFVIVLLVIAWIPAGLRTHDWWTGLEVIGSLLPFIIIIVYTMSRYRVIWENGTIITKSGGFGTGERIIDVKDITRIKQESSDIHTLARMVRPSHRITIYAKTHDGTTFTDVSLKHFNLADVRKLMNFIHERRPDLDMPKAWI